MKRYTTFEFIERAKKIFPDYDYSKVNYKSKRDDVVISCNIHGEFLRKPRDMFRNDKKGSGCPECVKKQRWSTELFKKRSALIHGTRYDYSKSVVKTGRDKVTILCTVHGEFIQQADVHAIRGCGCPECALVSTESAPVKNIKSFLEKRDIKFIQEKTFENCAHKRLLKFDFYLPDHNMVIEYDGEFHFKDWNNVINEKVHAQCYRDELKNEFAKENNIFMLRVSYKDNYLEIIKEYFDKKFND